MITLTVAQVSNETTTLGVWLGFAGVLVAALLSLLGTLITRRLRDESREDHGQVLGKLGELTEEIGLARRGIRRVHERMDHLDDRMDRHMEFHVEHPTDPTPHDGQERRERPRPDHE